LGVLLPGAALIPEWVGNAVESSSSSILRSGSSRFISASPLSHRVLTTRAYVYGSYQYGRLREVLSQSLAL
jgi:hypothetical protein